MKKIKNIVNISLVILIGILIPSASQPYFDKLFILILIIINIITIFTLANYNKIIPKTSSDNTDKKWNILDTIKWAIAITIILLYHFLIVN